MLLLLSINGVADIIYGHCGLHAMGVPGHDDIREQGQGARDGAWLLCRAAVFGGDHPVMDGALKTMDCLALIEQMKNLSR